MKALRMTGVVLIAIIIFGAGIGSGIFIDRASNHLTNSSQIDQADLNLINQAWNLIHQKYVDQSVVKPQNLTYGAISGMVNSLGDTDTVFL